MFHLLVNLVASVQGLKNERPKMGLSLAQHATSKSRQGRSLDAGGLEPQARVE